MRCALVGFSVPFSSAYHQQASTWSLGASVPIRCSSSMREAVANRFSRSGFSRSARTRAAPRITRREKSSRASASSASRSVSGRSVVIWGNMRHPPYLGEPFSWCRHGEQPRFTARVVAGMPFDLLIEWAESCPVLTWTKAPRGTHIRAQPRGASAASRSSESISDILAIQSSRSPRSQK